MEDAKGIKRSEAILNDRPKAEIYPPLLKMFGRPMQMKPATELLGLTGTYSTILADPPWRFTNRTGKVAPEHVRLRRYETMSIEELRAEAKGVLDSGLDFWRDYFIPDLIAAVESSSTLEDQGSTRT